MAWAFAFLTVAIGAIFQRVTGLGFVLVCGPLLVLALDPFNGIVLANILSASIALLVLSRTYRDTVWRTSGALMLGILIGTPLGAILVRMLSEDVLLIVVGLLTLFAVLLALFRHPMQFLTRRSGPLIAGTVSAFSSVTAGVGGPALAVYGVATKMPMQTFIPTVQVVSFATAATSAVSKVPFSIPLPLLLGSFAAMVVGMLAGSFLQRFVPAKRAQILALTLALVGAGAATVRGVLALVG